MGQSEDHGFRGFGQPADGRLTSNDHVILFISDSSIDGTSHRVGPNNSDYDDPMFQKDGKFRLFVSGKTGLREIFRRCGATKFADRREKTIRYWMRRQIQVRGERRE